ncbi:Secreted protein with beta-propeller repeat domain containing protein [Methanonatronarchaeum thermophilum]|uniref:Secreted protein with beta-propeller repeat domain containing protein n=1 Tax=Methanonatronarchaeum thermophilum TaxID=1927129 RepID=A0A1Y3GGR1_9EURY|nr:polymer-forming cytoskeletal protein [Methanonatronarchaeum thermophilum]OUJ18625.1 Secreted protein with beta-propeller repeat domain containing protein [Methanonatronarchaeum thermophilum]
MEDDELLVIPDKTRIEERLIVTESDIVIGSNTDLQYGIKTPGSLQTGERVDIAEDVHADGDVEIGLWSIIDGNLIVGEDAYIGERCKINGKLLVEQNLDIGNDVDIEEGFEANGWITIRNPIPLFMYFLLLFSNILRRSETEEIEEILEDMFEEEIPENALIIPRGINFGSEIDAPGNAVIGKQCRFIGNLRAKDVKIDRNTTFFGSIKSKGNVKLEKGTIVHGDIKSQRKVELKKDSTVMGNINADIVLIHDEAHTNGTIHAKKGVQIIPDKKKIPKTKPNDGSGIKTQEIPNLSLLTPKEDDSSTEKNKKNNGEKNGH